MWFYYAEVKENASCIRIQSVTMTKTICRIQKVKNNRTSKKILRRREKDCRR